MDQALIREIKFNCDVSDAKYWGFFSVCGLLMRYRDLYRSENGLKPWADIRREDISSWISNKESRWPDLEHEDFRPLTIHGKERHPFAVDEINNALRSSMLVYGAGYGMYMKPTFFLAELRSIKEVSGFAVYTSKREYVRDLFTSPGMSQGKNIFLRLEPLQALLMYKFSEWGSRKITALDDAFSHYGFHYRQIIDDAFGKRLEDLSERYSETILRHELAEAKEDAAGWRDILSTAGDRRAEHFLRAVKDLIADTSDYGPYKMIIETRDRGALGLAFALTDGFRKALYPEMKRAYTEFLVAENWSIIEDARKNGHERFKAMRERVFAAKGRGSDIDDFMRKLQVIINETK